MGLDAEGGVVEASFDGMAELVEGFGVGDFLDADEPDFFWEIVAELDVVEARGDDGSVGEHN